MSQAPLPDGHRPAALVGGQVCPPGSPVCRVRRLVVGLDSMGLVDAGHTDVTEEELQVRCERQHQRQNGHGVRPMIQHARVMT